MNLINNTGPDFKGLEELINLHKKSLQLELSLKLRKNIEYEYNKLKLQESKENIEEMDFQNKYINKRNQNIIEDIQTYNFNSIESSSRFSYNLSNLKNRKNLYQKYLDNILPKFKTEFKTKIYTQNNIFMIEKNKELDKLKDNLNKNKYYEELLKANENLAKEIKYLQNKNSILSSQNEEKEKKFSEYEEKLRSNIKNINLDNSNSNSIIIQNNDINNNKKDRVNNNYMKENIKLRNPKKPGPKIPQIQLNMNHKRGILDDIKQKDIDILNAKIREQYYQEQLEKELNESLSSNIDPLYDIKKQIINPKKQGNLNFNKSGTLNQNFESFKIKKEINNEKDEKNNYITINGEKIINSINIKNNNPENNMEDNKDDVNKPIPEGENYENNKNINNQDKKNDNKSIFNLLESNINNNDANNNQNKNLNNIQNIQSSNINDNSKQEEKKDIVIPKNDNNISKSEVSGFEDFEKKDIVNSNNDDNNNNKSKSKNSGNNNEKQDIVIPNNNDNDNSKSENSEYGDFEKEEI